MKQASAGVRCQPGQSLGLFPLPEVVLFPGVLLPLHVFEARYLKLTEDALAGNRLMGVAQVLSPTPVDQYGHPRIAPVAGIGEIIREERLTGGRMNILLRGVCRASLKELPFEEPYRRAEITPLTTEPSKHPATELAALISCLQAARSSAGPASFELASLGLESTQGLEPGELADYLAAALVPGGKDRQRVLEALNTSERVSLVCGLVAGSRRQPEPSRADRGQLN